MITVRRSIYQNQLTSLSEFMLADCPLLEMVFVMRHSLIVFFTNAPSCRSIRCLTSSQRAIEERSHSLAWSDLWQQPKAEVSVCQLLLNECAPALTTCNMNEWETERGFDGKVFRHDIKHFIDNNINPCKRTPLLKRFAGFGDAIQTYPVVYELAARECESDWHYIRFLNDNELTSLPELFLSAHPSLDEVYVTFCHLPCHCERSCISTIGMSSLALLPAPLVFLWFSEEEYVFLEFPFVILASPVMQALERQQYNASARWNLRQQFKSHHRVWTRLIRSRYRIGLWRCWAHYSFASERLSHRSQVPSY
jgi:hypothetical protein